MREAIRDIDRLRHIDECIEHINDFLMGKSFEDMKADVMCFHAVVYNITESALKSGIFEIQSGLCGYSGRYTANGSRCEKICKNHHKPAKSLSERPEKGKYRSLKC